MIQLLQREGRSYIVQDSAQIKNEKFTLRGTLEYPEIYFLAIEGSEEMKVFYLENSKITARGMVDSMEQLEIIGSSSNDDFEHYNRLMKPFDARMKIIFEEYPVAQQRGDEAKMQELFDEYLVIEDGMNSISKQFIMDHPHSFVAAGVLGHLSGNLEVDELAELLDILDDNLKISPEVQMLETRMQALQNTAVGNPAPDFELNDPNGNPIKLSDKIGARLLLVDFWAAWCNPCREENPNLVAVYNKYKDKGFDIFGISLDDDRFSWLEAIEADELSWTQVSQLEGWQSDAATLYAVNSIPANFLVNEEGIIIAKDLRGEDLEKKVKEILGG